MKFISIVVFVLVSAGMGSFMTFMDKTFGEPAGEFTLFSIVVGGGILAIYLTSKNTNKILNERAEAAKKVDDAHKAKSSKDWG